MDQPTPESTNTIGQPETEPSLNDIAGLLGETDTEEPEASDEDEAEDTETPEAEEDAEPAEDAEAEAEPEAEDAWKERKAKVSIQGEEHEITVGEALQGYMRQQDYTRKTAEAAELTRAAHAERQQVTSELAQRVNAVDTLAGALYRELVGDQTQLAGLIETDPQEYLRRQSQMQQKIQMLNQAEAQRRAYQDHLTNEQAKARAESLQSGNTRLLEVIPEWGDAAKRASESKDIAETLRNNGYTDAELAEMIDPRAVVIARKAALYDRMQSVKDKLVVAPPAAPPKPVKAGTTGKPNNAAAAKAAERYSRNPNSLDALAGLAEQSGI
jgi:hypothetical protein